jgi:hypothetical protein
MEPARAKKPDERQEATNGRFLRYLLVASVTIWRLAPFWPYRFGFGLGGTAGGSKATVQIENLEVWEVFCSHS